MNGEKGQSWGYLRLATLSPHPHQTHSSCPAGARASVVVTTTTTLQKPGSPSETQIRTCPTRPGPSPLTCSLRSTAPSPAWHRGPPPCGSICFSLLFPPLTIHANPCPFPGCPHIFYCFSRSISRSEMVLSIQTPSTPSPDPIPDQQQALNNC